MATFNNIVSYLTELNTVIEQINNSQSEDETKTLVKKAIALSIDNELGNSEKYISNIENSLYTLYLSIGSSTSTLKADEVNQAIKSFTNYLASSWWQFGGGTSTRKPIASIPYMKSIM